MWFGMGVSLTHVSLNFEQDELQKLLITLKKFGLDKSPEFIHNWHSQKQRALEKSFAQVEEDCPRCPSVWCSTIDLAG
jgi:hypothetical protein